MYTLPFKGTLKLLFVEHITLLQNGGEKLILILPLISLSLKSVLDKGDLVEATSLYLEVLFLGKSNKKGENNAHLSSSFTIYTDSSPICISAHDSSLNYSSIDLYIQLPTWNFHLDVQLTS